MFVMRILVKLMQPYPLLWIALLGLALWCWRRGQRGVSRVIGALWLFASLWSCTALGDRLVASLEEPWRETSAKLGEIAAADAIVVLGGGHSASERELVGVDMQGASDRLITAIELLRMAKAPILYTSGGVAVNSAGTEAEAAQRFAQRWMPDLRGKITPLPPSVDTHDEAMKMAALAKERGWKRIILVTSATHMTRSHAVFAKACGIEVLPAPCGFETKDKVEGWLNGPTENGFRLANTWWHEWVGWWGYKVRGWL